MSDVCHLPFYCPTASLSLALSQWCSPSQLEQFSMLFQISEEREGMSEDFIQSFSFLYFFALRPFLSDFPRFSYQRPKPDYDLSWERKMKSKVSKYWILSNTTGRLGQCLQWGLIWGLWDCQTTPRTGAVSSVLYFQIILAGQWRRGVSPELRPVASSALPRGPCQLRQWAMLVLWLVTLWHCDTVTLWHWHWRRSISFYLSDLWCSQTNYITRHHHWLVTNYIPWGGRGGGGGCLYYPGGPLPLAGTSNNKHLTAPDKWSSKLEMRLSSTIQIFALKRSNLSPAF